MDTLDEIKEKISKHQYEFSKHAVDQTVVRNISVAEVEEVISAENEIIEDYPMTSMARAVLYWGSRDPGELCMSNAAIQTVH